MATTSTPTDVHEFLAIVAPQPTTGPAAVALAGSAAANALRRDLVDALDRLKSDRQSMAARIADTLSAGDDATDLLAQAATLAAEARTIDDQLGELVTATRILDARRMSTQREDPQWLAHAKRSRAARNAWNQTMRDADHKFHTGMVHADAHAHGGGELGRQRAEARARELNRNAWREIESSTIHHLLHDWTSGMHAPPAGEPTDPTGRRRKSGTVNA